MALPETELAGVRPTILATTAPDASRDVSSAGWMTAVLLLLVLGPVAFNAIELWPEVSIAIPSLNDDAHHYLFIQRASEALEMGQNPFDFWGPEVELGFPYFFYYQHLPHLTVVLLHRLLVKQVDLLTLFNLIRYLLLVGFPLTVYWSMRRLGFSRVAGAVAAAASTLFASNKGFGLEYNSYTWRGHGMYTQLWATHLSLITLACLNRLLERGTGYIVAIVACSVLALSHLVYSYMMVPAGLVLLLVGLNRANAGARLVRLAVVGGLAGVITSYLSVPFVLGKAYLSASPYLDRWRYDSFGAPTILTWLVNGDMLDYGRLPVLTLLLALGIAAAVLSRTRPASLALGLLFVWLVLYFGRPTWGRLMDLLPMHEGVPLHRMVGGVHLAALLLIGLGGEWIWRRLAPLRARWGTAVTGLVVVVLLFPALRQGHQYYAENTRWMEQTKRALEADGDARSVLSALKELPPGRIYVGLRTGWGDELKMGYLHFYNLVTFHRIAAVAPPYGGMSLSSDLIWHFDDRNPVHYDLFNVRYVIAPRGVQAPAFWRAIKGTPRYVLYEVKTGGYARFAALYRRESVSAQTSLFFNNRAWFLGADLPAGKFVRYEYPTQMSGSANLLSDPAAPEGCPGGGKIHEEQVLPGRLALRVECPAVATVVVKENYHPNWRVTVDGRPERPFMVSPGFIGFEVPAGGHEIRVEYRSPGFKTALLLLGACTLIATVLFRSQFARLEGVLAAQRRKHA